MAHPDPSARVYYARLGGLARRAKGVNTHNAFRARWQGYLDQAQAMADGQSLEPDELEARAQALLRADMLRLSKRASEARAARHQAAVEAAQRAADRAMRRMSDEEAEP